MCEDLSSYIYARLYIAIYSYTIPKKPSLCVCTFYGFHGKWESWIWNTVKNFGIRWRTLPIWIRSHSAEYKADLIPASTNWILEMQNRLYIMQICKFVKEKYYANILIYSIKSNVQKNGLAIFMHICLIFEYLK